MYKGIPPSPDPRFMRKLKEYDKKLYFEFDRVLSRFVIRRKVEIREDPKIWIVETEDGRFRQPDERDIAVLYMADLWRRGGVKHRIRVGEQKLLEYERVQEQKMRDELRDVTKDNKYQLRSTFRKATNDGKALSPYRQLLPKAKGKTYKELVKDKRRVQ